MPRSLELCQSQFKNHSHSSRTQKVKWLILFAQSTSAKSFHHNQKKADTLNHCTTSVQFSCSVVSDSATPWTATWQASLSITNSWSLLKLMSIVSVIQSNHLILCHPLLLLPSIFPNIRVFSNESALHIRWQKYWSYSFNISPSNEHPGLISFRMVWLDLLAVQGIFKSLLLHYSSKASILQRSAFFIVQLSHPYLTTGKTIAFTRWTFAGKVMSLLFNRLSRLVITLIPRSQHLLISWLQSPHSLWQNLRTSLTWVLLEYRVCFLFDICAGMLSGPVLFL